MANVDRVNGFRPVNSQGSAFNAQTREYSVAASYGTDLFVGDPVKSSGTANADGVPGVELAAAGEEIMGVMAGSRLTSREHKSFSAASTEDTIMVWDDPNTIFQIQENGNMGVAGIGSAFDHVVASGSTVTENSGIELNSASAGATGQWKALGYVQSEDNEIGTNAKILVRINEPEVAGAGTGV